MSVKDDIELLFSKTIHSNQSKPSSLMILLFISGVVTGSQWYNKYVWAFQQVPACNTIFKKYCTQGCHQLNLIAGKINREMTLN